VHFVSKQRDDCSSSDEAEFEGRKKLKGSRVKKSALKVLPTKTKGFGLKKKRHFVRAAVMFF
jgi:hypothetical protein